MKNKTFWMLCILAIALAPLSAYLLEEGYSVLEKRFNTPLVYMSYPDTVHKVINTDGKEIYPSSLSELKYGYQVVWVGEDYSTR